VAAEQASKLAEGNESESQHVVELAMHHLEVAIGSSSTSTLQSLVY